MGKKQKNEMNVQIIIALIGVVGTIVAALIGLYATRLQTQVPLQATQTAEARQANANAVGNGEQSTESELAADCVDGAFSNVDSDFVISLEVGVKTQTPLVSTDQTSQGPFALHVTQNNRSLGAVQFRYYPASQAFKIISIVDADCAEVQNFDILERPGSDGALNNWDNLIVTFPAVKVRIRFGAQVSQFEFVSEALK